VVGRSVCSRALPFVTSFKRARIEADQAAEAWEEHKVHRAWIVTGLR
jgi:hypothetical protein